MKVLTFYCTDDFDQLDFIGDMVEVIGLNPFQAEQCSYLIMTMGKSDVYTEEASEDETIFLEQMIELFGEKGYKVAIHESSS